MIGCLIITRGDDDDQVMVTAGKAKYDATKRALVGGWGVGGLGARVFILLWGVGVAVV